MDATMADAVRQILESMVPELDALHERGIFTREELKEVVRRRTDFEYATRRPSGKTKPVDFMRYVEYELKLEELRRLRAKGERAAKAASDDKAHRRAKGRAEFCIVRRVHFIFSRAIKKFSGNIPLWRSYFDFCKKHGGSRTFSRTLTKALQLHPNKPGMWIEAASWELNGHRNEVAARALLQQGLRVCKRSEVLWLEYFHFELLLARRMQLRREVIKLSNGAADAPSYNPAIAGGAVAGVVARRAIEALGARVPVYAGLLENIRKFDPNAFPRVEADLIEGMKGRLGASNGPEMWLCLAQHAGCGVSGGTARVEAVCSAVDEALAAAKADADADADADDDAGAEANDVPAIIMRCLDVLSHVIERELREPEGGKEAAKIAVAKVLAIRDQGCRDADEGIAQAVRERVASILGG